MLLIKKHIIVVKVYRKRGSLVPNSKGLNIYIHLILLAKDSVFHSTLKTHKLIPRGDYQNPYACSYSQEKSKILVAFTRFPIC